MIHAIIRMNFKNMPSEISQIKRDHMSYDSIYMKSPEKANLQRDKVDQWLPGARGEENVE